MNYKAVIHDAWVFTRSNKRLMIWYSFMPSLLTTVVGIGYVVYQYFAFKTSHLFDNEEVSFLRTVITAIVDFFKDNSDLITPTIIVGIVAIILYIFLPTLMMGGLVQITARRRQGLEASVMDGVSYGILSFLVLFEYHLFIKTFSFFGIFTEAAFAVRNLEGDTAKMILPAFVIMLVVGLFLSLLFIYTDFFIVIKRQNMLSAMGNSAKLVVMSWQHTLLVVILMALISLRIIINIIAVLLVPLLIIIFAGLFASLTLEHAGVIIAFTIGFIALIVTAYFNGIIHLFVNTVWTYTFLELLEEEKNKSIIDI